MTDELSTAQEFVGRLRGYSIRRGSLGPELALHGPWRPKVARVIRRRGVRELKLNYAWGWTGTDIEFVRELPSLEGFHILDWEIGDVAAVHALDALRALSVHTYCRTPLDFSRFPQLECCSLEWRQHSDSLFDRTSLRVLVLARWPGRSSGPLGRLTALERLQLTGGALGEVEALRSLRGLRRLSLRGLRRLASLAGIEELAAIEDLTLQTCRSLSSIDQVAGLTSLRRLAVLNCGEIASLAPLRGLEMLEEVYFYESTDVLDGDLTPLLGLPRLRTAWFKNRSHYSHRREALQAELERRPG